jgi:hypothetical protein
MNIEKKKSGKKSWALIPTISFFVLTFFDTKGSFSIAITVAMLMRSAWLEKLQKTLG